jgi:hypothetical protein
MYKYIFMKNIKEQKRRRPPDVLTNFASPYGIMSAGTQSISTEIEADALHIAIFLNGKKLQTRTMLHCSGSRTSKKR